MSFTLIDKNTGKTLLEDIETLDMVIERRKNRMKYLAIAREFNEPNNNTPSSIISAKIVENANLNDLEKEFKEISTANEFQIILIKIEDLDNWKNIVEIW